MNRLLLPALAASFSFAGVAAAGPLPVVLLDEDFESGLNTSFTPVDNTGAPNPPLLSVVDDSAGLGSQALLVDNQRNFTGAQATFAPVTLGVGDQLELSYQLRYEGSPNSSNNGLRLTLGDVAGSGFTAAFGTGTSSDFTIFNGANFPALNGGNLGPGSPDVSLGDGDVATVTFLATGTATGSDLTVSLESNGVLASGTASNAASTFSQFVIGNGAPTQDLLIDNVLVTTSVPEPASLALLGLGGVALLRRRSAR